MSPIMNLTVRLMRTRRAVTALEYGLIASLIAVAIVTAVSTLGSGIATTFGLVSAAL
jgi:pilus assembly protein Flp/PilA